MTQELKDASKDEEDEIFKTLGHKIRREIIKIIGTAEKISFSEIQKKLGTIDSSSLSYHLKFLQPLIEQKNAKYLLTAIGRAAFNLLSKTDQSVKLSKVKNIFLRAQITTVLCWAITSTLVPLTVSLAGDQTLMIILVDIILAVASIINSTTIGVLRKKTLG